MYAAQLVNLRALLGGGVGFLNDALHRPGPRYPAVEVGATAKAHIELVEVAPNLDRLPALIGQRPYTGEEEETSTSSQSAATGFFTFRDLLARVQVRQQGV